MSACERKRLTLGAATEKEDVPGKFPASGVPTVVPSGFATTFGFLARLRVGGVSGFNSAEHEEN